MAIGMAWSSSSQPVGGNPFGEVKQPFDGVAYQTSYVSDIYITIHNSQITVMK